MSATNQEPAVTAPQQPPVEPPVEEVSLEEGLHEGIDAGDIDQAPDESEHVAQPRPRPRPTDSESAAEAQAAKERAQEDLDILAPKAIAVQREIGKGTQLERQYVQQELSVIGKAQWFSLVGEILDKAMSGESALSLNSLLSPPQAPTGGQLGLQQFQDADTFVHAVGKLMGHAPEFLSKSVCIWLGVPDYEWELVNDIMSASPTAGGLSDDEFEDIFATFIDQNYASIDAFFRQRFPRLRARYQARANEALQSRSSKR